MGQPGCISGCGYLDYHKSVYNALQTGDQLEDALKFTKGAQVTVAAHSLGNGVVAQAIEFSGFRPAHFLMINAALPIEAFSPGSVSSTQSKDMIEEQWVDYDQKLRASEWFRLFPEGDARRKLTWEGRYADVLTRTDLHHFYSTGEDVLANNTEAHSASVIQLLERQKLNVTYGSWKLQELVKGVDASRSVGSLLLSRGQAGWGFSLHWLVSSSGGHNYGVVPRVRTPNETKELVDAPNLLKTEPFFGRFIEEALMSPDPAVASERAANPHVVNDLLARAIPSTSYAAAANPIPELGLRNYDMPAMGLTAGAVLPADHAKWTHSSIKAFPLAMVAPAYTELVTKGSLR